MDWKRLLAYITGSMDQELLLRAEIATIVTPDTILAWYRQLVARTFDGSEPRKAPGRPPVDQEMEALVDSARRARIAPGATTGLLAPWPISATPSLTRPMASHRAMAQDVEHFHHQRPHQGKGNVVLMPLPEPWTVRAGPLRCWETLGGWLKHYAREAA